MSDNLKASDALAARQRAIETLLEAFGEAVKAGKYFAEIAKAEGIQTPAWSLEDVEYPIVFQALDNFFPMPVRRPDVVREYWINEVGGIRKEKYISK